MTAVVVAFGEQNSHLCLCVSVVPFLLGRMRHEWRFCLQKESMEPQIHTDTRRSFILCNGIRCAQSAVSDYRIESV
jgi:hypothetical protein